MNIDRAHIRLDDGGRSDLDSAGLELEGLDARGEGAGIKGGDKGNMVGRRGAGNSRVPSGGWGGGFRGMVLRWSCTGYWGA